MSMHRKPGRPSGSSRLNAGDELLLLRVADRIVAEPTLKVTPAMIAVGILDETVHRRLRRKWKPAASRYLSHARVRREQAIAKARRETFAQFSNMGHGIMKTLSEMQGGLFSAINNWAKENPEVVEGLRESTERWKALREKAGPVLPR